MCLVGCLKGVCSSLNNVPGETTECIDNHRVTGTRRLSIHSVVSSGTLFREEHKSFKIQPRHTTEATRNIQQSSRSSSSSGSGSSTGVWYTLTGVSLAPVCCLGYF